MSHHITQHLEISKLYVFFFSIHPLRYYRGHLFQIDPQSGMGAFLKKYSIWTKAIHPQFAMYMPYMVHGWDFRLILPSRHFGFSLQSAWPMTSCRVFLGVIIYTARQTDRHTGQRSIATSQVMIWIFNLLPLTIICRASLCMFYYLFTTNQLHD